MTNEITNQIEEFSELWHGLMNKSHFRKVEKRNYINRIISKRDRRSS